MRYLPTMAGRRTVAATLLLTVCASGLVAGCDGDSDATPPPSTTPSSTATTTPSATPSATTKPSPPVIPPAATTGLTVTAAQAFAEFYMAAFDYAEATGDTSLMRRWAYPGCLACDVAAKSIEKTYKAGGSTTGDVSMHLNATSVRLVGKDTAIVLMAGRQGASVSRDTATAKPTTFPAHQNTWKVALGAYGGHWTMFGMVEK
jgi:hypothetical protein